MAEELVSAGAEVLLLHRRQQPRPSPAFPQPKEQLRKPWEGPVSLPQADRTQRHSGQSWAPAELPGFLLTPGSNPWTFSGTQGKPLYGDGVSWLMRWPMGSRKAGSRSPPRLGTCCVVPTRPTILLVRSRVLEWALHCPSTSSPISQSRLSGSSEPRGLAV